MKSLQDAGWSKIDGAWAAPRAKAPYELQLLSVPATANPRLAAMDIQWSDVRPERSVYHRLAAAGAVERLLTDEEVARAVSEPPIDTRAYFRGSVVRRFPDQVRAASWDSVVLDVPSFATLRRVPLRDPWRGTKAHVGALLDDCPDARTLVERLEGG